MGEFHRCFLKVSRDPQTPKVCVNGYRLVQSTASLSRAIGPTLGGSIWSWSLGNGQPIPFDHHILVCEVDPFSP